MCIWRAPVAERRLRKSIVSPLGVSMTGQRSTSHTLVNTKRDFTGQDNPGLARLEVRR